MAPARDLTIKLINDLKAVLKRTTEAEPPDIYARFFTTVEFILTKSWYFVKRYETNYDEGWPHARVYDPRIRKEFQSYGSGEQIFTCMILNDPRLLYVLITFNELSYCLISFTRSQVPEFDIHKEDELDNDRIVAIDKVLFIKVIDRIPHNNTPLRRTTGIERDVILCNLPTELRNLDAFDCIRNKTADAFYNSIPEENRQSILEDYNDEAMLFSVINFMYTNIPNCKKLDSEEYLPNYTYNGEKSMFQSGENKFSISLLSDSVSGYYYLIIWNNANHARYLNCKGAYLMTGDQHVGEFKLSKRIVPTMKNTNQDIYLDNFRFQLLNNLLRHILEKCVAKLYRKRSRSSSCRSSEDSDAYRYCSVGAVGMSMSQPSARFILDRYFTSLNDGDVDRNESS